MQIASIELYDLLKTKLGEKEAKALVSFVEAEVENKVEHRTNTMVTKEEFLRETSLIRQDITSLEVRLTRAIYIIGLVQYLAILASLIAIVKVFLK